MTDRLIRAVLPAFALALVAAACGGTSITELSGPGEVRCQTSFGGPPPAIPAAGGTVTVGVSAARECSWTANNDGSWLRVSPTSGQGEASVTITAEPNPQASVRTGALIVNDQRLAVTQEPAPCRYSLSATSDSIGSAGGRLSVSVSSLAGCGWSVSSSDSWVRVLTPSGNGNGTVELEVDANPGGQRTAQVTIAGLAFSLTQAAVGPAPSPTPTPTPTPTPPPPAPPSACSYTIDPTSRTVGDRERNGDISVTTLPGCSWSATSSAAWLTIISGASGTGSGQVRYQISENTGNSDRTATINIAGVIFTLTQRH